MAVVQGAYGSCNDAHVGVKTEAVQVQRDGGWIAGIRETIVAAVTLGDGTVHLMARTRMHVRECTTLCISKKFDTTNYALNYTVHCCPPKAVPQ